MDSVRSELEDECMIDYLHSCSKSIPTIEEPESIEESYARIINDELNWLEYRLLDEFRCKDELMVITSSSDLDHLRFKHDVDMFNIHESICVAIDAAYINCYNEFGYCYTDYTLSILHEQIKKDMMEFAQPMIDDYIRAQH